MRICRMFGRRPLIAVVTGLAIFGAACGSNGPSESLEAGADSSDSTFTVKQMVNPQLAESGDGVVVMGGSTGANQLPTADGIRLTLDDGRQRTLPAVPGAANALSVTVSSIGSRGVLAAVLICPDHAVEMDNVAACGDIQVLTALLEDQAEAWTTIALDTPADLATSVARGEYLPVVTLSTPGPTAYLTVQAPVVGVSHMYELVDSATSWSERAAPPPNAQTCATDLAIFAMVTDDAAVEPAVIGAEPPGALTFFRLDGDSWTPVPAVPSQDYAGTPYLVCSETGSYVVSSNPDRTTIRFENLTDRDDRAEAKLTEPQPLSSALGTADNLFAFTFRGDVVDWSPGINANVRHALDAAPTAATYNPSTSHLVVAAGNPGTADNSTSLDATEIVSLRY